MTIDAVHLVDEGAYLVELPWGLTFEVGGVPTNQRSVVVQSLSEIVVVTRTSSEVATYKNDSGDVMDAAEYSRHRAALLQDSKLIDDVRVFTSLEAEFAFRKFDQQWKPHEWTPSVETRAPATDIRIVEVRTNSGDSDIVSLWNSPSLHHDRKLYSLNVDRVMVTAAQSLCARSSLSFHNDAAHSAHLRFAKIEGEYAFDDSFSQSSRPFIGTLPQCRQKKAECIDRVQRVVSVKAAKKNGVKLANAGNIAERLANVNHTLSRVNSKSNTQAALSAARREVASLLRDIENNLEAT